MKVSGRKKGKEEEEEGRDSNAMINLHPSVLFMYSTLCSLFLPLFLSFSIPSTLIPSFSEEILWKKTERKRKKELSPPLLFLIQFSFPSSSLVNLFPFQSDSLRSFPFQFDLRREGRQEQRKKGEERDRKKRERESREERKWNKLFSPTLRSQSKT